MSPHRTAATAGAHIPPAATSVSRRLRHAPDDAPTSAATRDEPCRGRGVARAARAASAGGTAGDDAAVRSARYALMTGLPLVRNVAVRPDHGAPWDIREGTRVAAVTDAAVGPRELQCMLQTGAFDGRPRGPGDGAGPGGRRVRDGCRGRFLKEMKQQLAERVAKAARGYQDPTEGDAVPFEVSHTLA